MKNQTIRKVINVDKNNFAPLFNLKQEDDALIKLSLLKNNTSFDITGQTVSLCAKRPNNTIVEQIDGFTINKNELDIALKNNVISVPGKIECDLEFKDADGKMTTASFYINVDKKITGKDNIDATNEIATIDKIKNQLIEIRDEMSESNESYKTAESNRVKAETSRTVAEQTRVNEFNTIKQEYRNAYEFMGQYEVQEDPSQIRFRDAKGNFGKTVNLGGIWASSGMVNYGGRDYYGNSFSGETSDHGLEISKIKGNYYQKTTKGYQLFDASKFPTTTKNGLTMTNNGDGSFTFTGQKTGSFNFTVTYTNEEVKKMFKVGKITIDNGASKTGYPYVECIFKRASGSTGLVVATNQDNRLSGEITEELLNEEGLTVQIIIYISSSSSVTLNNIKPMLYQDGDGTFEPFTGGQPSPNPDYPQEVKFFKPRNVYGVGKNLFDFNFLKNTNATRGTKTFTENSITLTATSDDCFDNNYTTNLAFRIPVKPNTEYTLLYKRSASIKGSTFIFEYSNKDETNYLRTKSNTGTSTNYNLTFTTSDDCNYIAFRVGVSTKTEQCTFSDFMLLEGKLTWGNIEGFIEYKGSTTTPFDIELRALPSGAYDELENGVVKRKLEKFVLDGVTNKVTSYGRSTNGFDACYLSLPTKFKKPTDNFNNHYVMCEELIENTKTIVVNSFTHWTNRALEIFLPAGTFSSTTEANTWLQSNQLTFYIELETPTVEEVELPLISSYYSFTQAWHDSEVEPKEMVWKARTYPLVYTKSEVDKKLEELQSQIVAQVMGLMPTNIQSYVIENDYNNLINELEAIENK